MSQPSDHAYAWNRTEGPHSCAYLTPKLLEILAALKPTRLVDLGSGNGALCGALAKAGYRVVGVEEDAAGVELARAAHPDIRFHRSSLYDDPNPLLAGEALFDTAVSTEVIEHLFDPSALPKYAAKVLVPGGRLIVSTPYHGYLKNLALSVCDAWDAHHTPLWTGGHIKFWSRRTLTRLLEDNGFQVEAFYGVGRVSFLWKSMLLVAKRI